MRLPRLIAVIVLVIAAPAAANVVEYNNNRPVWLSAAGKYTQITFQGFANNTLITNQFSSLGVTFTDGTGRIFFNAGSFPNDGVGLYGAIDTIALSFTQPRYSIAVDYPGSIQIKLYWQGSLTYTGAVGGFVGAGFFKGLISDQPFDAAIILDPLGNVNIDDLYFGGQVPAPACLPLFAIGMVMCGKRRSRHGTLLMPCM